MSRRVKVLCLAGLATLIGIVCRLGLGQPPDDAQNRKIAELFAQARPHLEAALGYPLPVTPEFRVLSPVEYEKLPAWETNAFLRWRFPSLQGAEGKLVQGLAQQAVASATVCRHIEGTNVIAVLPEHVAVIAGWDDALHGVRSPSFLQLELVRAIARMTLERKYGLLDRRFDPHSYEEYRVRQAVEEGRAHWLTRQVARRLGCEDLVSIQAQRWLHVPDPSSDPQQRAVCQIALQEKHWACTKGLQFIEAIENAALANRERLLLQEPPRQVAWLEQPELFLKYQADGIPDLRSVFPDLAARGPADHKPVEQPWTPGMLRQVAGMFGEEKRIDRIAAGWRDGRSIVWTRAKDPGDYVALSAVRFDSEDQARAYFGFGVDLQRKRDEQSSATSTGALGRIIESKYHAVTWPKCQEGLRNEKTLAAPAGGGHRPAAVVLVRSGTLVVEVSWQGRHAQMDWARQQVDVVLSRLARQ